MGVVNQDLAIVHWFSRWGKNLDFDRMVYFEYDLLVTKPVKSLYEKYEGFDAGFVDYRVAELDWYWYQNPAGAHQSLKKWLKQQGKPQTLTAGFFPAHMLSKKVLQKLAQ